jgi:general secretion pathway protein G
MHKAFTMIELIFVIVIIGILATTALPKLAATRTDAQLAAKAQNIVTGATDIAAYALARNGTTANLANMSLALSQLVEDEEAIDTGTYQLNVKVEDVSDCIIIKITNSASNTETLIIEYSSSTNDDCDRLRNMIDNEAYPMLLHGQSVVF